MPERKLPRASSPEEAGVSPGELAALMGDIVESKLELHSVMVVRHGVVAYENFRRPYSPNFPHVMFSVSKSVTSCAVGFAVEEGLLALEDPVADLVPELREYAPGDPNLEALTVRHLLTMTAGKLVSPMADKSKKRWVKDYADGKWSYAPGEGWNYSSENTYMLCVVLKNVTGMGVTDYLMPRLFGPLGIPRPFWENDGCGVEAGGWGLYLTTESFAKIVACYAQGGVFEGKQVIPAAWVEASGQAQARNQDHRTDEHGGNGYGYCFWLNKIPGSYRADGVFSQLGLIFPQYGACVITTGGEVFTRNTLDCFLRHLPQLFESDETLPEGEEIPDGIACAEGIPMLPGYPVLEEAPRSAAMEEMLEGRTVLFPAGAQQLPKMFGFPVSVMPAAVFFMSADKAGGIDKVRFRFQANTLKFSWNEGAQRNTVLCGMDGRARLCKIALGGVEFVVNCSAAWEGDKLHVWIRPVNTVAERRLAFTFKGRQVRMLPRSAPSISVMAEYAAPFAATMIPNPALAQFVAGSLNTIVAGAEPMHFGFLR
ncbi:MAG: beta-lactamase family protein [Oscillospiraceae bacterium]|jgi:CubicO group peptidase (beta-lactamase class C family)|nr:beta-lactamase family protein [Oscillospiraceae bacterium]